MKKMSESERSVRFDPSNMTSERKFKRGVSKWVNPNTHNHTQTHPESINTQQ